MRYDNVLPFDPVGRGGMARRGSADKNTATAPIVLACPRCARELRIEADWRDDPVDVLCGSCETHVAFAHVAFARTGSAPDGAPASGSRWVRARPLV